MVDYHPRDAQSADENVGQGFIPCRVDSVTHKGLPYVVYEIVGQGLVPCRVDSVTHKGLLPYVN